MSCIMISRDQSKTAFYGVFKTQEPPVGTGLTRSNRRHRVKGKVSPLAAPDNRATYPLTPLLTALRMNQRWKNRNNNSVGNVVIRANAMMSPH